MEDKIEQMIRQAEMRRSHAESMIVRQDVKRDPRTLGYYSAVSNENMSIAQQLRRILNTEA